MDAKGLLRRYLEQRRELGESELVLDTLHVEDVMRLIGAAGRPKAPSRTPSLREIAEQVSGEEVQDWRSSLRQAGVNVDATKPIPRQDFPGPTTDTEFTESASTEPPATDMVVVVLPREYVGDPPPWIFQSDSDRLLLSVGGRHRGESVYNGLEDLDRKSVV